MALRTDEAFNDKLVVILVELLLELLLVGREIRLRKAQNQDWQ